MDGEKWPRQRTAILVLHGIGSQYPIETLDHFTRTLAKVFEKRFPGQIAMDHRIAVKKGADGKAWRDNYIRIRKGSDDQPVDIYEYYWANLSENKVKLSDLQRWVWQVTSGASKFYEDPTNIEQSGDKSIFFTKEGKFRKRLYRFCLFLLLTVIPGFKALGSTLSSITLKVFPFLGVICKKIVESAYKMAEDTITNIVGDVAVYNSTDPKSSFYEIRSKILGGAVDALRYLVDMREGDSDDGPVGSKRPYYGRVLIAGHSLGSQIAFDSINRLTHIISTGKQDKFDRNGGFLDQNGASCSFDFGGSTIANVREQLCGLVTFGSPLDKIAFFLNEQVKDDQYLRQQILKNYHCFKRKDLSDKSNLVYRLESPLNKIFDGIKWYNYHDKRDPISGRLDYYEKVKNVRRHYKGCCLKISHARYWDDETMFEDIVDYFINPVEPLKHEDTDPKRP